MTRARNGFTILELLVASLLLGMLVTILTMLFNQSSVSWRTGVAGVADMDDVRKTIAEIRTDADNAYVWNGKVHRLLSPWKENGSLRRRAWDVDAEGGGDGTSNTLTDYANATSLNDFRPKSAGSLSAGGTVRSYTVNVKSAGPDGQPNTYDDIWSFPDEIN